MSLALLHSQADIIRRLLIQLGVGTAPETYTGDAGPQWPVYAADEPDAPDNAITVYDTAPVSKGRIMIGGEQIQDLGFTATVRGDHVYGFRKAKEAEIALNESVYDALVNIDGAQYIVHSCNQLTLVAFGKSDLPGTMRRRFNINGLACLYRKT